MIAARLREYSPPVQMMGRCNVMWGERWVWRLSANPTVGARMALEGLSGSVATAQLAPQGRLQTGSFQAGKQRLLPFAGERTFRRLPHSQAGSPRCAGRWVH